MSLQVQRTYNVVIEEHPKEGAQEWLGNTQHMFLELLDYAVNKHEIYGRVVPESTVIVDLYVDTKGTKSETGTYYWDTRNYSGARIKKLYGPVRVKVSTGDQKKIHYHNSGFVTSDYNLERRTS